jgi:UDP-glucose 4-epimerase
MKNKILVTGAAGFIGSHIARDLIERDYEVWSIDNLSTGFKENLHKDIIFIEGNCQDSSTIRKLNNTKFRVILHFAGQSSGEISFDDPIYDLETNTKSTLQLLEYAYQTDCKRFIYASSMSVYGNVEDIPIPENYSLNPLSFYGVGKLTSERYLRIYNKHKNLNTTSLRLFNVYGPGQNLKNLRQGMVSIYLAQMLKSNTINIKGDLTRFRDFIYIEDIVKITRELMNITNTIDTEINIGTGKKTTVLELFNKLNTYFHNEKKYLILESTPGDQKGIYADNNILLNHFNNLNLTSIDEGLDKMCSWAIKND